MPTRRTSPPTRCGNRTGDEHEGYTWERPTQQPVDIEVLHSIERPNITAVFGNRSRPAA